MQNSAFWTRISSLYGTQTSSVDLSTHNRVLCTTINRLYWFQPSPVVLCMQNSDFRTRITSLCRSMTPTCGFCMQNSDFWTRIASLYGCQTWPVILFMYNSVLSIRNTSRYGNQPSSVVFARKTTTFGPDLQVSKGIRPHLSFWACNTAWLLPELLYLWVPSLICDFCIQNSDFWSRIITLCGIPTSPVVLFMQISVISNRIINLYGSQT